MSLYWRIAVGFVALLATLLILNRRCCSCGSRALRELGVEPDAAAAGRPGGA